MKTNETKPRVDQMNAQKDEEATGLLRAIEKGIDNFGADNPPLKELLSSIGFACMHLNQQINRYDQALAAPGLPSYLSDAIERLRRDALEARNLLHCDWFGGDVGDPHSGPHIHHHG